MEFKLDKYIVIEAFLFVATIVYTIFLGQYKIELRAIQNMYSTTLERAFAVVGEPHYFNYLFTGLLFIALLIGFTIVSFNKNPNITISIVTLVINIVLLIVLLTVFMDPILTSAAIVLLCGGVFAWTQS